MGVPFSHLYVDGVSQTMCRRCITLLCVVMLVMLAAAVPADANVRSMKLETVDRLSSPPDVVWMGSSTSREIDPGYVSRLTGGRRLFISDISAGRFHDDRYMAGYMATTFPDRPPHMIVGIDVERFRSRPVIEWRRRADGATPLASERMTSLGYRRTDPYATVRLSRRLPISIERHKLMYRSYDGLAPGTRRDLQHTIITANERGVRPTLVMMPVHPRFERALRGHGRAERKLQVKRYLRDLKARGYDFAFVDASSVTTIGGSSTGFADGVHLRRSTANALLRHLHTAGLLVPPRPTQ